MSVKVAIFDLDGTVVTGDSFVSFLLALLKKYPTRLVRCIHLPFAVCVFYLKLRSNSWLKDTFLRAIVGGLKEQQIQPVVEQYVDKLLAARLKQGAVEAIRSHQRDGLDIVLATASPDLYIHRIAEKLSIDHVVATQLQWQSDVCLGRLRGQNCYGEEKLEAIRKQFRDLEYAYSDHHSDLPLLLSAKRAVAIDPTPQLRELALQHDLPITTWEK